MKIVVFLGSSRSEDNCPGQEGKTKTLAVSSIEHFRDRADFELIDLAVSADAPTVQPCKGCVSTAGGYHCHWPCSCYGPDSGAADKPDLMYEFDVYRKLEECDGFLVFTPIYWYAPSTPLKALFDRLVCANLTLSKEFASSALESIKDPEVTQEANKAGLFDDQLKNWLEGKFAGFYVHGDMGADDYDRNPKPLAYLAYDEASSYFGNAKSAVEPLVWQCRYSGIHVPNSLVVSHEIGKGQSYAEGNDEYPSELDAFLKGRQLVGNLIHMLENKDQILNNLETFLAP